MDENQLDIFEKEQEAIENYIDKVYSTRVPPPETPETSFWKLVGIKTLFFSMSSLGAIVFSAIRTGGYFYIVEYILLSKYNIENNFVGFLSFLAFASALFAFEGFALADGFSKGEKMNGVEESNFGLWASFITIMLVGIFSGLEIAEIPENIRNFLTIVTAVLTSISAGSIAFFGGKNLGYAVSEFSRKKKRILEEHQESYDNWRNDAFRSYTSTMGGVKSRLLSAGQLSVQNERRDEQNNEQFQNTVQREFNRGKELTAGERAMGFLTQYVQKERKIPSADFIVEQTGVSKGTANNYTLEYIHTNADALLLDGLVDEARVEKAAEYYNNKYS